MKTYGYCVTVNNKVQQRKDAGSARDDWGKQAKHQSVSKTWLHFFFFAKHPLMLYCCYIQTLPPGQEAYSKEGIREHLQILLVPDGL